MPSQSQTEANRKNAARSTGPKTASGKAASSRNATKHGLSSAGITVLPTESQDDLDALARALTDEHQPQGDTETFLVHQMLAARWKLARIERLESEAFDDVLESGPETASADRCVLDTLAANGNIFEKLQHHAATAERSYYKALRELERLRKSASKQNEQNEAKSAQELLNSLLADTYYENGPFHQPNAAVQNEPNLVSDPDLRTPEFDDRDLGSTRGR